MPVQSRKTRKQSKKPNSMKSAKSSRKTMSVTDIRNRFKDMDENIRAFLLSYNIPLSGKKEENRARLTNLSADWGLVLRWIDPKNGDVRQIDTNARRKKAKKNKT